MTRELGMTVGGGLCSSRREMDIFLFSTTIFHVRVQYYEMSIEFIEIGYPTWFLIIIII